MSRRSSAGGTPTFTPTVIQAGGGGSSAIAIGAVVDGKYRVDAVIGQGGMGAVFRAWDLRLERAVAIKVVRADLLSDPDSRARFRRESQIVARLQHPSIVTVFDSGTLPDGAAYLVMEFVPGEDLRQMLKREGSLTPARTAALLQGIAAGVESAHQSGIFHRDLKPENILLPESGMGPKVVDFGVAKLTEQSGTTDGATITVGGTIVGTPAYMSPEQLRGEAVDGRTDVFSLGVMAYEMLTGTPAVWRRIVPRNRDEAGGGGTRRRHPRHSARRSPKSFAARSRMRKTNGRRRPRPSRTRSWKQRTRNDGEPMTNDETCLRHSSLVVRYFFLFIAARRRSISATAWPI